MNVRCTASALKLRTLPQLDADTDSGKRLIRDQLAGVFGKSLDAEWLYVSAPAGVGWVSREYVEEAADQPDLPTPKWPHVPNGRDELERLFGPPGGAICQAGRAHLPKSLRISWEPTQNVTVFACHKLVEDVLSSAFAAINNKGLWDLLVAYGGCYNYRQIKASTHLSTHAWGIAVDLNPEQNALGAAPTMDQRIVAIFRDHGFKWGGEFSRPDGMHFQRATGY